MAVPVRRHSPSPSRTWLRSSPTPLLPRATRAALSRVPSTGRTVARSIATRSRSTGVTAAPSNDGPVAEGSAATVSFSAQFDPSGADTTAGFHYAFDWLNGDLSAATYAASGASSSTTCTFNDNGTYTVKGRIIDKDGGFTEYTTDVEVTNVDPSLTAPADQASDEGTLTAFNLGSFTD